MRNYSEMNRNLHTMGKYKALFITKRYLSTMLILLTFYVGYFGLTLVPFYLLVLLAILPELISSLFHVTVSDRVLPYAKRQLGFTSTRYKSNLTTLILVLALLFLWQIRSLTIVDRALWLRFSPAILIISSFAIYTIGQYYYLRRFHECLMGNEMEKIH